MREKEYNKAYVIGEYVRGLGLSIHAMLEKGDHKEYYWNSGNKNNPHRIELINAIHEKAMEAINSLTFKSE